MAPRPRKRNRAKPKAGGRKPGGIRQQKSRNKVYVDCCLEEPGEVQIEGVQQANMGSIDQMEPTNEMGMMGMVQQRMPQQSGPIMDELSQLEKQKIQHEKYIQQQIRLQRYLQQQQIQHLQQQNPQMESVEMQNAQITGMVPQQQQNILQARGMTNPNQRTTIRMRTKRPNMSSQLTAMAVQPQQRKNRTRRGPPKQVENVNVAGPYPGQVPQEIQQQKHVNHFVLPNNFPGSLTVTTPAPTPMAVISQVAPSPSNGNYSGVNTIIHSLAGPGINMNTFRPYDNRIIGVPSPNPTLNAPMSMDDDPSPRTVYDQACFEKLEELKTHTDLVERMIAKFDNEDTEKSRKMRKLLDVLTVPNHIISMDLLLKCEQVVEKMLQHEAGEIGPPTPKKDTISGFKQIQLSIMKALQEGSSNQTALTTLRQAVDAIAPPLKFLESAVDDVDSESDSESISGPCVLMKELQLLNQRLSFNLIKGLCTVVSVTLRDIRLPRIPPLKIVVPHNYPAEKPKILNFYNEYVFTPFLRDVARALKLYLGCEDTKPTVTEIIRCWEMSVRQVQKSSS